jgi:hypothetical protein
MGQNLWGRISDLSPRASVAIVGCLGLALGYVLARRGLILGDEGYILLQSLEMARGAVLYRDLDSFVSPGIWLLHALLFQIVEPSVLASRMLAAGCFATTCAFVFLIARRVASPLTGWLAVAGIFVASIWAFPAWTFSFYSPFAIAFVLVGLERFLAFHESRKIRDLALCGLTLSLAIVFKQNYGMLAVFGILVALVADHLTPPQKAPKGPRQLVRDLGVLALSAIAVAAPLLLYFAAVGALEPLIDSLIIKPFQFADQHEIAYPGIDSLWNPIWGNIIDWLTYGSFLMLMSNTPFWPESYFAILGSFHMLLFWIPPACFALAGWHLLRTRRAGGGLDIPLLAVASVAAFVYLGVFPRADYNHLLNIYQPIIVLGAVLAHAYRPALAGLSPASRTVCATGLGLLAAGYVGFAGFALEKLVTTMTTPVIGLRGGVLLHPLKVGELAYQVNWIRSRTAPHEPILTIPDLAMLNFLADRPLPGAYYNMYQVHIGNDRGAGVAQAAEAERVRYVITRFHNFFSNKIGFLDYAPELAHYVRTTFTPMEIVGHNQTMLMKRKSKPSKSGTRIDALEDCELESESTGAVYIANFILFRALVHHVGDGRYGKPYTVKTRCRVRVPRDATLAFSIDYADPARVKTGSRIDLHVRAIDGDRSESLYRNRSYPKQSSDWSRKARRVVELDLNDYEGQEILLEFETTFEGRLWMPPGMLRQFTVNWNDPRIEFRLPPDSL